MSAEYKKVKEQFQKDLDMEREQLIDIGRKKEQSRKNKELVQALGEIKKLKKINNPSFKHQRAEIRKLELKNYTLRKLVRSHPP